MNEPHLPLWQDYLHVLTDPGHALGEITYTILVDVLLIGLLIPALVRFWRRRLASLHAEIDAEHDVNHDTAILRLPREAPSWDDIQEMRSQGVNEWLLRMLVEHYHLEAPPS